MPMNAPPLKSPAAGPLDQRLRLAAGLVLFSFVATHFLNHGFGNVSLAVLQAGQDLRYAVWGSWAGQAALYGALALHAGLALVKLARRRTWRMPAWEAVQLLLGLAIPSILIKHAIATRGAMNAFDTFVDYRHEVSVLWQGYAFWQSLLLLIVWTHGCIGLHYWLRLKPWYRTAFPWLLALAAAMPVWALSGWLNAARLLTATGATRINFAPGQREVLAQWAVAGRWTFAAVFAAVAAFLLARHLAGRLGARFRVTYADGRTVRSRPGPTLLEISRANRVPHMSICGGRARCSTCRTRIISGAEALGDPGKAERAALARAGVDADVRLACQIRPAGDVIVRPLLGGPKDQNPAEDDHYRWGVEQPVTVMFVDLRGFTAMSENRLPYDVVFILNRYLDGAAAAIRGAGGHVDKVMGDGIMALFGIGAPAGDGARSALAATVALAEELTRVNAGLRTHLETPLKLGIGIHTGPAILGRIGLAGDTGAAAHLTALGDTVNVASRLEGASKKLACLAVISQAVFDAATIPEPGEDAADEPGIVKHEITLRGRTEPLRVWAIHDVAALAAALAQTGETVPS